MYYLYYAALLANKENARYNDALKICKRLIREGFNDADVYKLMGRVYLLKNKNKNAVRYFTTALHKKPDDPVAYFFRAIAFHELGKFNSAVADLKKTVILNPNSASAHNYLGYI